MLTIVKESVLAVQMPLHSRSTCYLLSSRDVSYVAYTAVTETYITIRTTAALHFGVGPTAQGEIWNSLSCKHTNVCTLSFVCISMQNTEHTGGDILHRYGVLR